MFKYLKKELRLSSSEYAEYIDDDKTISVEFYTQYMFSFFFSSPANKCILHYRRALDKCKESHLDFFTTKFIIPVLRTESVINQMDMEIKKSLSFENAVSLI